MSPSAVSVVLAAILALALVWTWRREFGSWKVEEYVAAALVPLVLFAAVLLLVKTPAGDLDRLSGTFALASKLGLKAPEVHGPVLKPGEGPIASAAYLP